MQAACFGMLHHVITSYEYKNVKTLVVYTHCYEDEYFNL
jgi:hypothetical protein